MKFKAIVTVAATAALTAGLAVLPAGPANAAARLSVDPGTVGEGPTTVTVKGSGFLVPAHKEGAIVFGGVYLFFGAVKGTNWGPSNRKGGTSTDGLFGYTYFYPGEGGDASTRGDSSGDSALVSFTENGESGGATSYHMDEDGSWTAKIRVPGYKFTTQLPQGGTKTFDCRKVTCGVFTIGAHGKAEGSNETFTALKFPAAPESSRTKESTPTTTKATAAPRPTTARKSAKTAARETDSQDVAAGGDNPDSGDSEIFEEAPIEEDIADEAGAEDAAVDEELGADDSAGLGDEEVLADEADTESNAAVKNTAAEGPEDSFDAATWILAALGATAGLAALVFGLTYGIQRRRNSN